MKQSATTSWLRLLAVTWAALCMVAFAVIAVNEWRDLARVCTDQPCMPWQLHPDAASALGISLAAYATVVTAFSVLTGLCLFGLAWLVSQRARDVRARWVPPVLLAMGATTVTTFDSAGLVGGLLQALLWVALSGLFWLVATFPSLRFEPRWTVVPTVVASAWAAVTTLVPPVASAISADDGWWAAAEAPVFALSLTAILAGQVVRFRRGTREVRRQLELVVAALAVFLLVGIGGAIAAVNVDQAGIGTLAGTAWQLAGSAALCLVMAAIAVSLLRHHAYGVEAAVRNTLAGALIVAFVTAVYAVIVALTSIAVRGWSPGAVGALAAAVALIPVRDRVTRVVDRLVYGEAADPLALVAELNRQLAAAQSASELLPGMVDSIAVRLRLPRVVLTLADGHPETVTGGPDQTAPLSAAVPLPLGQEQVGGLEVALRPGQRRLSARDRAALTASAGPLAGAVVAVRLTSDLQRSRTALVTAREEERQVLRSQLHDEFGPTMAGLRHRVNAARRDLHLDTGAVEGHLVEADELVASLLADVRELARGLRPPELDEFGLVGAVRRFAGGLSPVPSVVGSVDRRLPAAVETAAYRIVIEAMLNAERHARPTQVRVQISTPADCLVLEVVDDGAGLDPDARPGVGLVAMRQRAAELGGTLSLQRPASGGTSVRCELPIVVEGI